MKNSEKFMIKVTNLLFLLLAFRFLIGTYIWFLFMGFIFTKNSVCQYFASKLLTLINAKKILLVNFYSRDTPVPQDFYDQYKCVIHKYGCTCRILIRSHFCAYSYFLSNCSCRTTNKRNFSYVFQISTYLLKHSIIGDFRTAIFTFQVTFCHK